MLESDIVQFVVGTRINDAHQDPNIPVELDLRGMLWVQPENSGFYDTKGKAGGLLTVRAAFPLGGSLKAYAEAEGKTQGWVMANPYLKDNLSIRAGIALDVRR